MTLIERQSSDSGALLRADSLKKGCALMLFVKIEVCPPAVPDVDDCCEHCTPIRSADCPSTSGDETYSRSKFSCIERKARGGERTRRLKSECVDGRSREGDTKEGVDPARRDSGIFALRECDDGRSAGCGCCEDSAERDERRDGEELHPVLVCGGEAIFES